MKLLFDQNISFRLVNKILVNFPNSVHVKELGLINATDSDIWEFAKKNDFAIVTFDADFADLSTIKGFPPKIIWLRTGNTITNKLESLLKQHAEAISTFLFDSEHACLEIHG